MALFWSRFDSFDFVLNLQCNFKMFYVILLLVLLTYRYNLVRKTLGTRLVQVQP